MNESTRYTNSDSFVLNSVHMIDGHLTLSDPVEELCLFASKETLVRCLSGQPRSGVRMEEIGLLERGALIQTVASWELCCYSLLGCAGSRLNALYFESFRKVHTAS
ncbi:hypothetical protein ATANTOWER_004887 [Ataeniobius toweri]|uniref:Uncharacterized protein n=1 Tax=Ataeniobius toweri TaxID=208326 RepID=A0ABU7AJE4_9TELE|nr:hypothetical protein [Ataeniobius toweri]